MNHARERSVNPARERVRAEGSEGDPGVPARERVRAENAGGGRGVPARERVRAEGSEGDRGAPCPVAQRFGRHAAALVLRRKPGLVLDPGTIERAFRDDANIYPLVKRCRGDWITGYYAEIQR